MKIDVGLHTIIMLVGATNTGKSTWAQIFKEKINSIDPDFRCTLLTSDELNDKSLSNPPSTEAVEKFLKELASRMNFPDSHEFIVVDTTWMEEDFRNAVKSLAEENLYRVGTVLFDYAPIEHIKNIERGDRYDTIIQSAAHFRKRVFPSIRKKDFDYHFVVREKTDRYFNKIQVSVSDHLLWASCQLDSTRDVMFIGDIHEHVDALKEMIKKIPKDTQVVLLGDYLDKGYKTAEIIPVIEEMLDNGAKILIANHESYIARRLTGKLIPADNEEAFFTSLSFLQNSPEWAKRFLAIYNKSIPFAFYKTDDVSAYATHAPCENKYLGKLSSTAMREQRNFFMLGRSDRKMSQDLAFMKEEALEHYPIHIFGHVAHGMESITDNKKVWLDTGAVYGNKLSAYILKTTGEGTLVSVPCKKLTDGKLFKFVDEAINDFKKDECDPKKPKF